MDRGRVAAWLRRKFVQRVKVLFMWMHSKILIVSCYSLNITWVESQYKNSAKPIRPQCQNLLDDVDLIALGRSSN